MAIKTMTINANAFTAITRHGAGGSWTPNSEITTGWQDGRNHAECKVSKIEYTIPTKLDIAKVTKIVVRGGKKSWPYDVGGVNGVLSSKRLQPGEIMLQKDYTIEPSKLLLANKLAGDVPEEVGGNLIFDFTYSTGLTAGTTLYIYFYRGEAEKQFGMSNVSLEITYESYIPIKPASIAKSTAVYAGNTPANIQVKWTNGAGVTSGTKQTIQYFIEGNPYGTAKGVTGTSDVLTLSNPASYRGQRIYAQITSEGPYNTVTSNRVQIGKINSLPYLTVTQNGNTITNNNSITFTFAITDSESSSSNEVRYRIDNGSWTVQSSTQSLKLTSAGLTDGPHSIVFVPIDDKGEEGSASPFYNFQVQTINSNSGSWSYTLIASGAATANLCYDVTLSVPVSQNTPMSVSANLVISKANKPAISQNYYSVQRKADKAYIHFNLKGNDSLEGGTNYQIEVALLINGAKVGLTSNKLIYPNLQKKISFNLNGEIKGSSNFYRNLTCSYEVPRYEAADPSIQSIKLIIWPANDATSKTSHLLQKSGSIPSESYSKTLTLDFAEGKTYHCQLIYILSDNTIIQSAIESAYKVRTVHLDSNLTINYLNSESIINPVDHPTLYLSFASAVVDLKATPTYKLVLKIMDGTIEKKKEVDLVCNCAGGSCKGSYNSFYNDLKALLGSSYQIKKYSGKIGIKAKDNYSTAYIEKTVYYDFNSIPTFPSDSFAIYKNRKYYNEDMTTSDNMEITSKSGSKDFMVTPGQSLILKFKNVQDKNDTSDLKSIHLYYAYKEGTANFSKEREIEQAPPNLSSYNKFDTFEYSGDKDVEILEGQTAIRVFIPHWKGNVYLDNKVVFFRIVVEDAEGNLALTSESKNYLVGQTGVVIGREEPSTFTLKMENMVRQGAKLKLDFYLRNIDSGSSWNQLGYNNFQNDMNGVAPSARWKCQISKTPSFSDYKETIGNITTSLISQECEAFDAKELFIKIFLVYQNGINRFINGREERAVYLDETPTVSHRFHYVAINGKDDDLNSNQSAFMVRSYEEKKQIRLKGQNSTGVDHEIRIYLDSGEMTGTVIDGGEW